MTLTEKRRSKDMALGELARKCNLGSSVMSRIERGIEHPPDAVLAEIGMALGWTQEEVRASLPSKEEAQAEFDKVSDALTAMSACQDDAKAKGYKKGNGGRGFIPCPICKGRLHYSVASHNGHMWGRCETEGCVSWMQ